MMNSSNILFIVEGERTEPRIIERIAEVYNLHCKISSVHTNIYNLYKNLKGEDGYCDVIPVLKEILNKRLAFLHYRL